MVTLTAAEAQNTLFDLIKHINQTHDIVRVQHKFGNAIVISSDDYESIQENLFLLSQPGFKDALNQSVRTGNRSR